MLCVLIVYISGENDSLKSTPDDRLFEKLFIAVLITLSVFADRKSPTKYFFFCILF